MCVKITIKNKSSRDIPQELVEEIQFKTLDEINSIAEQYNLKVTEMTNEYKNAKLMEQELTFGDRYNS